MDVPRAGQPGVRRVTLYCQGLRAGHSDPEAPGAWCRATYLLDTDDGEGYYQRVVAAARRAGWTDFGHGELYCTARHEPRVARP